VTSFAAELRTGRHLVARRKPAMNPCLSLSLFVLSFLMLVMPARADVLAGKICEGGCDRFRTISIFGDAMNGNTEPLSLLGGPTQSGLLDASAMVYDAGEKTVLVADFFGQKIHVFPADARGDVAPLRSFSSPQMGQPRNVVRATGHDEYIALSSNFVLAFARNATGSTAPLRSTTFAPTVIDNASGLAYLPASDEVAVGDYQDLGGNQSGGEVLIFPRTISGAPVASRRIAGPSTQLGSFVNSLAVDPAHNELFVLVTDADARSRIVVFPVGADGNVAPTRVIGGNNTRMSECRRARRTTRFRDELLVASGSFQQRGDTGARLRADRAGRRRAEPRHQRPEHRRRAPPPAGYAVVGVPLALVFGDGFE
jgi:hypothetical protein